VSWIWPHGELVRCIENHDASVAAAFSPAKERAAALTLATLRNEFFMKGGSKDKDKTTGLGRRPDEPADEELRGFYTKLRKQSRARCFDGQWSLCGCMVGPTIQLRPGSLSWVGEEIGLYRGQSLGGAAQGSVQLPWGNMGKEVWQFADTLSNALYDRAVKS
jgi:hypothetical protein